MSKASFLEVRGITKRYGENTVLQDVSFSVDQGSVHALLGENGAGKSTLMNILFGMPVIQNTGGYEGEILIEGKPIRIESPRHAMELGIGMVHQEFMLIPGFTVAENIKLNREVLKDSGISRTLQRVFGSRMGLLDIDQMGRDAVAAMKQVDLQLEPGTLVEGLPVGYMQFLEIAREIDKSSVRLLVFDEPTAVLTESEAAKLLEIMRRLSAEGIAIIFITHRLDEAMAVCNSMTILRDGEVVADRPMAGATVEEMAELMVGRKVETLSGKHRVSETTRPVLMELKDFGVDMPGENTHGVHLQIRQGEILGIGGLGGQGKLSIANGIMGIYPTHGEIWMEGKRIEKPSPLQAIGMGCAFVSEDRRGSGLLLDSSIENNIVITAMHVQRRFLKQFGLFSQADHRAIREHCRQMIRELDIRCTSPLQATRRLSGGNQQKVCVARALTLAPRLLLVSEPTRGIDIGAKRLLLEYLVRLNQEQGVTVVITSSELAELRSVCDRIAIVSGGRIERILSPEATDAEFGLAMSGLSAGSRKEGGQ